MPTAKAKKDDASLRFLFKAAMDGELRMLKKASEDDRLDLGGLIDPNGRTLLHFAADGDHPKVIEFLMNWCDPDKQCNLGETALMTATRLGHFLSVQKLAQKTDLDAANGEGKTALMIAAFEGEAGCVSLLANANSSRKKNIHGQTALMIAIRREHWDCAFALLPHSDLSAKDNNGNAAVWFAAIHQKWDLADALASKMSAQEALLLRKNTPCEIDLPMSEAVIEQAELAEVVKAAGGQRGKEHPKATEATSAEEGSPAAGQESTRRPRRV